MRFVRFLLAGVLVVSMLSGCTPVDFWGNGPDPTPTVPAIDASCASPLADVDQGLVDPAVASARPADVRPGNSWIVVGVEVRAVSRDVLTRQYVDACIPVAVHLYKRSVEADTIDGSAPVDFTTTTPFVGRYLSFQYDPTLERFQGRPPTYEFHIDASYIVERDIYNTDVDVVLRCAITINGASIASDATIIRGEDIPGTHRGRTVQCTFTGNDHWNHY